MENLNNDIRIGSLPGDRQGTSGAGAGRGSMRTVSGRRLNRRVTTNQVVTAETINTPTLDTPHGTTRSALQDMRPATTLAGKERQRMKWTDEINQQLLRCYYTVTDCETNLTGYRPALYTKFINIYPDLHNIISEQRLADQIRVIHRNNRISPTDRETIKRDIQQYSNYNNPLPISSNHLATFNINNNNASSPSSQDLNSSRPGESTTSQSVSPLMLNTQTTYTQTTLTFSTST